MGRIYSLLTCKVLREFASVSEAPQGVHALQDVGVQIRQRQDPLHANPARGRLLWARLVATTPEWRRRLIGIVAYSFQ